ncbi:hypothetical protein AVEN_265300-1 [Araneus ventricosus]|uniref:Secreted protein n=1 Tax=Araneus ventricosus TaxID=182803 RepID=A0A4Y2EJD4_ARAVE|nr:hypothetical protein AVEN_265300-1 [Araneus ventricosus]
MIWVFYSFSLAFFVCCDQSEDETLSSSIRTEKEYQRSHSGVWINDLDANAGNAALSENKIRKKTCSLCETPGPVLFRIPSYENK